jgi:hypothetical protein
LKLFYDPVIMLFTAQIAISLRENLNCRFSLLISGQRLRIFIQNFIMFFLYYL